MKVHTVKSNAKRASRKVAADHPDFFSVADPIAFEGGWCSAITCHKHVYGYPTLPDGFAPDDFWFYVLEGAAAAPLSSFTPKPKPEPKPRPKATSERRAAVAALAKSIPPTKSTPEEIAARREARVQRMAAEKANPTPKAPRDTKSATILDLVARPDGATVGELMDATGWQAHTLRGYIAGTLRKRGHMISMTRGADGAARKAYRM